MNALVDRNVEKLETVLMRARSKSGRDAADHVLFVFDLERESWVFAVAAEACTKKELHEMRTASAGTIPYEIICCSRHAAEIRVRHFKRILEEVENGATTGWEDVSLPAQSSVPPGYTLIVVLTAGGDEGDEDAGGMVFNWCTRTLLSS
jgi:hypothetical protein